MKYKKDDILIMCFTILALIFSIILAIGVHVLLITGVYWLLCYLTGVIFDFKVGVAVALLFIFIKTYLFPRSEKK